MFLAAQPSALDDPPTAADEPGEETPPVPTPTPVGTDPQVLSSSPADGATGVARDASINMEVYVPNGGIDAATVNPATVYIIRVSDGERVPVAPNTTGGGDAIIVKPIVQLQANLQFRVVVTTGVKDITGKPFKEFSATFTTGTGITPIDPAYRNIRFDQVPLPTTHNGVRYIGLTIGPDRQALRDDRRRPHPSLRHQRPTARSPCRRTITSAAAPRTAAKRYVTGDRSSTPRSTADNLIALGHAHRARRCENAPDWTGKISRLSGPNLDSLTRTYVDRPAALGARPPDQPARLRPRRRALLRAGQQHRHGRRRHAWRGTTAPSGCSAARSCGSTSRRSQRIADGRWTLNGRTDGGGTYNPYAADAPLTIYATGVRNAYDLLLHSQRPALRPDQRLRRRRRSRPRRRRDRPRHRPGLAAPATTCCSASASASTTATPTRSARSTSSHGGNPTANLDPFEVTDYPVGVTPPTLFRGGIFNFGHHDSPNGLIEYKNADAFDGASRARSSSPATAAATTSS